MNLTPEERQAWKELKEMRDEDIDLSDIPLQTGGGWRRVSDLFLQKTSARSRFASMLM